MTSCVYWIGARSAQPGVWRYNSPKREDLPSRCGHLEFVDGAHQPVMIAMSSRMATDRHLAACRNCLATCVAIQCSEQLGCRYTNPAAHRVVLIRRAADGTVVLDGPFVVARGESHGDPESPVCVIHPIHMPKKDTDLERSPRGNFDFALIKRFRLFEINFLRAVAKNQPAVPSPPPRNPTSRSSPSARGFLFRSNFDCRACPYLRGKAISPSADERNKSCARRPTYVRVRRCRAGRRSPGGPCGRPHTA